MLPLVDRNVIAALGAGAEADPLDQTRVGRLLSRLIAPGYLTVDVQGAAGSTLDVEVDVNGRTVSTFRAGVGAGFGDIRSAIVKNVPISVQDTRGALIIRVRNNGAGASDVWSTIQMTATPVQ